MSLRTTFLPLAAALLIPVGVSAAPKKLLLVGQGPDGHPPQTHEYMPGVEILGRLLKSVADLEVSIVKADGPWREGPELMQRADGVVMFVSEGAKWLQQDAKRLEALGAVAKRGGGLAGLHWAIGTKEAKYIDPYLQLLGGCHGGPDRKFQVLETDVEPADPKHPICAGLKPFRVKEEFYYKLKFVKSDKPITPVLRAKIDGEMETVCWAWERPDGGRAFGFSGLHFHDNWKLPEYRRLVAQGVLWSMKLPIPEKGLPVDVKDEELKVKRD
jgi:type 1 glutamine amidotransferase